jgi:hypothetical protein
MLGIRLDIAFAVIKLAQQSANPIKDHLSKVKYILAYLNSTRNYTLDYNGKSGLGLVAFVVKGTSNKQALEASCKR